MLDKERIRNLQPAYFALVMATGIVSIACSLQQLGWIADVLLGLNTAFFAVLAVLPFARLGFSPSPQARPCWAASSF